MKLFTREGQEFTGTVNTDEKGRMTYTKAIPCDRCLCGATDCSRCYPGHSPEPTDRHLELALEKVVEEIMEHGQWPVKGRAVFDLYDYLLENRDESYAREMLVTAMSSDKQALAHRIERERKTVEAMLTDCLSDSNIVYDLACEYAAEENEE